MIYTVTLNPSIDYVMKLSKFIPGEVNRTKEEQYYPGGKGLNVSMILKELGQESVALGFVAGFTGEKIIASMKENDITTDFIKVENGFSRINVKIKTEQEKYGNESGQESEINGTGPVIEESHIQALLNKLGDIQSGDIIVLGGSLPKGVSQDLYKNICQFANEIGAKVVVDASGIPLERALQSKPFLVKPNVAELEQLMGMPIVTEEELVFGAKAMLEMGAEHVIVSCGKDGAVFIDKEQIIWQKAVEGVPVNTVGSGDSLVAGVIDGWLSTNDWKAALKEGVAAGTAGAFCDGLAGKEQILDIYSRLPY